MLQVELKRINDNSEGYVFHDDLAEINTPIYFHELIARAAEHELQYLAEADYFEMQDSTFAPAVAQMLRHVAGDERILQEQYADFLKCRKFRQTLLCHRAQQVAEITDLTPFAIASSASVHTTLSKTKSENAALEFRDKQGQTMTTNHPLLKAAMQCLVDAWPGALPFSEVLARSTQRAKLAPSADSVAELSQLLLKVYGRNLVSLYGHPPSLVTRCGPRPRASALARLQSAAGRTVTNFRHENVELAGPLAGNLLRLLDGTRTREDLIAELARTLGAEHAAQSRDALPATVAAELEIKLAELARLALIEA